MILLSDQLDRLAKGATHTMLVPNRGDVVDETTRHDIAPGDIDASKHFWDAFDHMETEISAGYIVRLCQERGRWSAFTYEEINDFYRAAGNTDDFLFNRLVEPGTAFAIRRGNYLTGGGWVVKGKDNKYRVTTEFIQNCHRSSPRRPQEVTPTCK